MINEKLINMFLQNVEQEDLIRGVKELLNHLKIQSNYAFEKQVNNFINIVGGDKPISINDIDIELIKSNIDKFVYKSEGINKDSIKNRGVFLRNLYICNVIFLDENHGCNISLAAEAVEFFYMVVEEVEECILYLDNNMHSLDMDHI